VSVNRRKLYASPLKDAPIEDLPFSAEWDITDGAKRCGLTWTSPSGGGFDSLTLGSDSFFDRLEPGNVMRRACRLLFYQMTTDALDADYEIVGNPASPPSTLWLARCKRLLPLPPTVVYPSVAMACVFRVVDSGGTPRVECYLGHQQGVMDRYVLKASWFQNGGKIGGGPYPTFQTGDHLVWEIGAYGGVTLDQAHDAYFESIIEVGDGASSDLAIGNTEQKNSWKWQNLYTPDVPSFDGNAQARYQKPRSPTRSALRIQHPPVPPTGDFLGEEFFG